MADPETVPVARITRPPRRHRPRRRDPIRTLPDRHRKAHHITGLDSLVRLQADREAQIFTLLNTRFEAVDGLEATAERSTVTATGLGGCRVRSGSTEAGRPIDRCRWATLHGAPGRPSNAPHDCTMFSPLAACEIFAPAGSEFGCFTAPTVSGRIAGHDCSLIPPLEARRALIRSSPRRRGPGRQRPACVDSHQHRRADRQRRRRHLARPATAYRAAMR